MKQELKQLELMLEDLDFDIRRAWNWLTSKLRIGK